MKHPLNGMGFLDEIEASPKVVVDGEKKGFSFTDINGDAWDFCQAKLL